MNPGNFIQRVRETLRFSLDGEDQEGGGQRSRWMLRRFGVFRGETVIISRTLRTFQAGGEDQGGDLWM